MNIKTIISDSPPVVSSVPKQMSRRKRFGIWLRKFVSALNPFRGELREVQETYIQR
jgi:hypothetical protein